VAAVTSAEVTVVETRAHAGGTLHLCSVRGCTLQTWTQARLVRVWTPAGFSAESAPAGGYSSVYLADAQNVFEDALAFVGVSWRAALSASKLTDAGSLPSSPVIVAIDNAGSDRGLDYLPYPPGTGDGDFRPEAAAWPGGGVDAYLACVIDQIKPLLEERFALSTDASRTSFGGSSLGGLLALQCAMRYPETFGSVVIESPSFWVAEGRMLEEVKAHAGAWPERVFVGFGGKEFTGQRPGSDRGDIDAKLVKYTEEFVQALRDQGVTEEAGRLDYCYEEGAHHHEQDWARRFPRALRFALTGSNGLPRLAPDEAATVAANVRDAYFFTLPGEMNPGVPVTFFINRAKSDIIRDAQGLTLHIGYNGWRVGKASVPLAPAPGILPDSCDWWVGSYTPPAEATQMNFVLSADGDLWDNNDGDDYLMSVHDPNLKKPISAETIAQFDTYAEQNWAEKHGAALYFTVPSPLVAGEPGAVFYNRKRCPWLKDTEPIAAMIGFNSWSCGNTELTLERPDNLPKYDDIDWMRNVFNVPPQAFEVSFSFCDDATKSIFDNNDDNDYTARVSSEVERIPRTIQSIEEFDHAGGKLEIVRLNARPGASRRSRWKEERLIRVWTPPGYHKGMGGERGLPVLYMNDGKNLFEDELAHQGVSWAAGYTAAALIREKKLPPFIIVGIDSPGPFRSQCYLPFPPGIGINDHRPDAERWPGGDVEAYMDRIVHELLPLVHENWGGSMERELLAFGGASFGGVCSLYTAMHYPHVFGGVLAESPSIWSNMGAFLPMMEQHEYARGFPDKLFVGTGTLEYSATRDHDWAEMDEILLNYSRDAVQILEAKGCHQHEGRLAFEIDEGGGHFEGAWAHRFYGALQFVCEGFKSQL